MRQDRGPGLTEGQSAPEGVGGGPGRFSTAIHVRVWVGVAALRGCEGLARPPLPD